MLSAWKPSTMYKGLESCELEMAEPPRMRMLMSAPGAPSTVVTCTPAILPAKASAAEATGTTASFCPEIEPTEPVKSLRALLV